VLRVGGYPDNPVLQQAISSRIEYLREKAERLYELEAYFVVNKKHSAYSGA
jgi:hypothetical protein